MREEPAKLVTPTVRQIQDVVAARFGVTIVDLVSDRRGRTDARPRQLVMWLARHCTLYSYTQIGKYFGGRDHTTVGHAVKRVEERMEVDPEFRHMAIELRNAFLNPNRNRRSLRVVA